MRRVAYSTHSFTRHGFVHDAENENTNPLDLEGAAYRLLRRETTRSTHRSRFGERSQSEAESARPVVWSAFFGTRGPDRRGQAPKGAGGMPRRRQQIGRGRLR